MPSMELNTLLNVEDFVEETEVEASTSANRIPRIGAKVLGALLLGVGAVLCLVPDSPIASVGLIPEALFSRGSSHAKETTEWPETGKCLCIFDVDRTLTSRQLQTDAETDQACPKTQYAPEVNGKVVIDYAYRGGRLRLSDLALKMDQTFCVQQQCFMGVISAGGASGDDEKAVLYSHLNINSIGRAGGEQFGTFNNVQADVPLQKITFTPDPMKGDVAEKIFQSLNDPNGKNAGIPRNKVWLFDDHLGNAGEMAKFGFNGREVSCKTRDQSIGNGLVGLCGGEVSEVIPSIGISTCSR